MENILIIVIVSAVVLWLGWSFYRTLTGKKGCGCTGQSCDSNNDCTKSRENNDNNQGRP